MSDLVRRWVATFPVSYEIPQSDAEMVLWGAMVDQLDEQGYEPAPDATPTYERVVPFPGTTVWGQDEDGNWIGDPRDYRLIGRIGAVRKR